MRKLFFKIHLWLSIPFGIIIAIVCISGAILVFETEILEQCYSSRYFVKEVKGEPLSPAELISSARQQLPDSIKISGLRVTSNPKRTYQVVLPGKKAAAFIDPYTGQITGIDQGQGFFMQTMRLHRWLLDTYKRDGGFSWGKSLVGWSTLILVIILISGIVIWWPRSKKALKNRLKIQTKKGAFRFWYDLHVSGGFYVTLFLLILALTGLTWSFGWYRNVFYNIFGVSTQAEAHASAPAATSGKRGSGERKGGKQTADYTLWADVLANLQNKYSRYNSITIQDGSATVSTARYGNTRGSDRYSFDPVTGTITETQLYKDLPKSAKIRGWIYSVHVGSWGGITTRILSCLVSLLGGVFAITGYYFWIKKKVKKIK
ncbi:PepSY domain-containing protein [Bacteroides sp. 519]|uniref:PepSY-associated TM helix domain-containing protein n=1 Tax=Bacteroides sp. 519 TaxID=2302937 RepID=UPI0013D3C433|nr:PepSY-associated TM helix domain-containing protein [Bacteroides sp. 519]NDV57802.1 PepSY domain-containing protein [Bacteroides sp. 519]